MKYEVIIEKSLKKEMFKRGDKKTESVDILLHILSKQFPFNFIPFKTLHYLFCVFVLKS